MATITLKGSPYNTSGELPAVGSTAPDFVLVGKDLNDVKLSSFKGKKIILNIFPSCDTSTCATSAKRFNEEIANRQDLVVISVSMDLPFASSRFCSAEGLENVTFLSNFRGSNFGSDYGVTIKDGPLKGLFARAIVVIDENGKVEHTELVPEIADEPDYETALKA